MLFNWNKCIKVTALIYLFTCACMYCFEWYFYFILFSIFTFFVLYLPYHKIESKKPPVFDVPLKPLTVDEGKKLTLRCHVCGSAPLKVQWMKDRKDLISAGSTKISFSDGTACLEISQASVHDDGDYLCKATNEAGSDFCKARVTVKGKGVNYCFSQ